MQDIIGVLCFGCKSYRKPDLFLTIPKKGSSGPYRCEECGSLPLHQANGCPGCGNPIDRKGDLCTGCHKLSRTHAWVRIRSPKEKTCQKCQRTLPISEFGVTVRRSDGHNNLCRECHLEGVKQGLRTMQTKAPGKVRAENVLRSQEHRMQKLRLPAQKITSADLGKLWDTQRGKCHWCDKPMNPFTDCTIEHLIPIGSGGQHVLENLALSCNRCNMTRNNNKMLALELYLDSKFSKEY